MKINGVKLYFTRVKVTLKKKGLKSVGTGVLGTSKTVLHLCKGHLKKKGLNSKKKGLKSLGKTVLHLCKVYSKKERVEFKRICLNNVRLTITTATVAAIIHSIALQKTAESPH